MKDFKGSGRNFPAPPPQQWAEATRHWLLATSSSPTKVYGIYQDSPTMNPQQGSTSVGLEDPTGEKGWKSPAQRDFFLHYYEA